VSTLGTLLMDRLPMSHSKWVIICSEKKFTWCIARKIWLFSKDTENSKLALFFEITK